MAPTKNHPLKKWEVSIMEISKDGENLYKVTRRLAELSVAETKIFNKKEDAKKQFEEWLQ